MAGAWQLEVRADGVGVLWADDPVEKVNLLGVATMRELESHVAVLAREGKLKALVVASRKPGCFFAGADVREIREVRDPQVAFEGVQAGQDILDRLSRLPIPTVAAVDGTCLGGGLELALACGFRVVSDNPKTLLGLPEVKVGIIPGFGGTQRLPRVVGLQEALKLILAGGSVDGKKAVRIGLADELAPAATLVEAAVALALEAARTGRKPRRYRPRRLADRLLEGTEFGRRFIFKKSLETVMASTRGHYPAPLAALAAVREGYGRPMEQALAVELGHEVPLLTSPVKENLIRLFFWMEEAKKRPAANAAPRPVSRVGVLGAGVMGGGIAQLAASKGMAVRMKDVESGALGRGLKEAERLFSKRVKRGRLARHEADAAMARISPALTYDGLSTLDVVVEAVVEKLEVKRKVLAEVEAHGGKAPLLFATNTSSLPISQIAADARHPDRVVGLHFFNPVEKMPLVEVIRGRCTSEEAVATAAELAKRLGKVPVVCEDGPGFLVNRLLMPYLNESCYLLLEGATVRALDEALLDFGMPMGPARLLDEVGLDVAYHVGAFLESCFPERMPGCPLLRKLVEAGLLGKKGGEGFYRYAGGRAGKEGSAARKFLPPGPGSLDAALAVDRVVLPMVNEACRILDEGVVKTPEEVDLGMILGTGFPPFRGGLLLHADTLGIPRVVERLRFFHDTVGPRFAPAPRLVKMAERGERFHGG